MKLMYKSFEAPLEITEGIPNILVIENKLVESGLVFVRKFGRTKLINIIDQIVEIDYKMKTGDLDESLYAELALMRIFDIIEN